MRGIPKFLLPCSSDYETLIERHIRLSLESSDLVVIPTRAQFAPLLAALGIATDRVMISVVESRTMNETVGYVVAWLQATRYSIIMPDTFFGGEAPYEFLANSREPLELAAWTIREAQRGKLGQIAIEADGSVTAHMDKSAGCPFPHSWGAMSFSPEMVGFLRAEEPHVGYVIDPALEAGVSVRARIMQGEYFDCGTPKEYLDLVASKYFGRGTDV